MSGLSFRSGMEEREEHISAREIRHRPGFARRVANTRGRQLSRMLACSSHSTITERKGWLYNKTCYNKKPLNILTPVQLFQLLKGPFHRSMPIVHSICKDVAHVYFLLFSRKWYPRFSEISEGENIVVLPFECEFMWCSGIKHGPFYSSHSIRITVTPSLDNNFFSFYYRPFDKDRQLIKKLQERR